MSMTKPYPGQVPESRVASPDRGSVPVDGCRIVLQFYFSQLIAERGRPLPGPSARFRVGVGIDVGLDAGLGYLDVGDI